MVLFNIKQNGEFTMNTQNGNALVMAIANDTLVNIAVNEVILIDGLNKRVDMGELKELAESIKAKS